MEYDNLVKSKSKIRKDLNVRAAFIHVLGDLVQSVGVFLAALMIYFKVQKAVLEFLFNKVAGPRASILKNICELKLLLFIL